jgi:hypothetical protein
MIEFSLKTYMVESIESLSSENKSLKLILLFFNPTFLKCRIIHCQCCEYNVNGTLYIFLLPFELQRN